MEHQTVAASVGTDLKPLLRFLCIPCLLWCRLLVGNSSLVGPVLAPAARNFRSGTPQAAALHSDPEKIIPARSKTCFAVRG